MQFCSTLSYRCEKDVQFKQMSHAMIARHERKAWNICIILGLSLKTALVREEIVRYEVICTVWNAKFSFYRLHYNLRQDISFWLWSEYRDLSFLLMWQYCCRSLISSLCWWFGIAANFSQRTEWNTLTLLLCGTLTPSWLDLFEIAYCGVFPLCPDFI